jgi:DHA1 family tetracycline resistance protein-like MFS transporter
MKPLFCAANGSWPLEEIRMLVVFLIVFVDLVGFGIIIPLLPFYGEFFGASPAQVGLLMASYSLTQFLAAPLWGRLSDRAGRKPVLIVSLAGISLAYVWLAYADSLWMLFAARALAGIMAGNIGVAFAYVADITDSSNRAKGMGVVGAAFGLGFIFGPAIGGALAGSDPHMADYRTPALAAAAFSAIAVVLAITLLKESLSRELRAQQRLLSSRKRWQQLREAIAQPGIALVIGLAFLANFVFAGMETTFAMWSRRAFGWGPEQNGYLFAFVGLLAAAIQGGLIGGLAKRFGEGRLIVAGALALAIGMLFIPLSGSVAVLLVAMTIVAFGFGIVSPSLNSLVSLKVGPGAQGGIMGVTRSASTLARVVGPIWAGALFHYIGRDWPYYAGAVVMGIVAILGLRMWSFSSEREPAAAASGAPPEHAVAPER